jgi:LuxR family maltose regulon positive regulatory protein
MGAILSTRLHIPAPAARYVARPRITRSLQQGMARNLTLVSAPAGFGKTTAVATWLQSLQSAATPSMAGSLEPTESLPTPVGIAWYSMAETDDFTTFVAYLVAAIRQAAPDLPRNWRDFDRRTVLPAPEDAAAEILQGLEDIAGMLYVVLDDYHTVDSPLGRGHEATVAPSGADAGNSAGEHAPESMAIHQFTRYFVRYLPPAVRLVILSRFDPPIGIAHLRGRGQVSEVRARHLAFSAEEADTFLRDSAGLDLDASAVNVLWTQTEGWAIGLRLAAISLQDSGDRAEFVRTFAAHHSRHIADYLMDEALGGQPPEIQDFLLRTSILQRFCRGLCAATVATMEPLTVATTLEYLERRGLFLVQLDEFREWGRYHSQFRALLHDRLLAQFSSGEVAALHARAAQWLADHDLVDDALQHFSAAGEMMAAAKLVVRHIPLLLRRSQWSQAARWLNALSPEVVAQNPALLLLRAWVYYNNTGYAQVRTLTSEAECLLAASCPEASVQAGGDEAALWGQVHAFRASPAFAPPSSAGAIAHAEAALHLLPESYGMVRGFVVNFLGHQTLFQEGYAAAERVLQQAIAAGDGRHTEYAMRLAYAQVSVRYLAGSIDDLHHAATQYERLAQELDLPSHIQLARTALAIPCAESNDRATATMLLAAVFAQPELATFQALRLATKELVDVHGDRHKREEVDSALALLRRRARVYPDTEEEREIEAMEAYLAACRGDIAAATAYARAADHAPRISTVTQQGILLASIHLLLGQPHNLKAAAELAERLMEQYRAVGIVREQIGLHVLLAKVYRLQSLQPCALQHLRRALDLGYPRGYRHVFTGETALMPELLRELRNDDAYAAPATFLLAEISRSAPEPGFASQPMGAASQPHASARHTPTVATLSGRELEVLELVAQNLTNDEIARRLVLSPSTVRNHTVNIYDKLHVRTRREAVQCARMLGVIA